MKLIVEDAEGRYSIHLAKITCVKLCGYYTVVEAVVDDKLREFRCREDFWTVAKRIERLTWKKIYNDFGVKTGPWGDNVTVPERLKGADCKPAG